MRRFEPVLSTLRFLAGVLGFLAFMAAICLPLIVMGAAVLP